MGPSEGNNVTYPSQQYVAAKSSTAASQINPTLSGLHSKYNLAVEIPRTNAKDASKIKTLQGGMQTGGAQGTRTKGDGRKGSEEHKPPAKSSKAVKIIKQPRFYQTYLIPGINTEKYPYEAGDEDED